MRNIEQDATAGLKRWGSLGLLLVLAGWTWSFARTPMGPSDMDSILHLPDLVFHEAGHVLFMPFGRFMTVLGGSLTQVLVPIVCAVAFIRQDQRVSAGVCAWWAGQNLVDLAPYIADARALNLVLLGGQTGAEVEGHDWEFILTQLGALHLDRTIGLCAHYGGLLVMMLSLGWAAWSVFTAFSRQQAMRDR